jgi:phosphoribulokinase
MPLIRDRNNHSGGKKIQFLSQNFHEFQDREGFFHKYLSGGRGKTRKRLNFDFQFFWVAFKRENASESNEYCKKMSVNRQRV